MKGEEAVRRLVDGEPDALDAVSAAYTPLLNYVIFAILEDKQEREECLADVLHQVWQAREQFDAKRGSFTTWLTTLARNAALNRKRAQRRREAGRTEWDEKLPPRGRPGGAGAQGGGAGAASAGHPQFVPPGAGIVLPKILLLAVHPADRRGAGYQRAGGGGQAVPPAQKAAEGAGR